ncbi:Zinc ABC transporter, periplasmic-binding protein ZnuA [hydrothermal vent metagenome]|uniref:Zinc ABC transporter, periplasmic-binding protein ZnuA n=1 Tax=hydrothermal vent metagenome TaxID=652676 RepID=A0A1W1E2X3_9ZZZZ
MKQFLFLILLSTNVLAAPNVVVSIKPIHSIVSNLTQGVTMPELLLKNQQSAHHFHLRPSQLSLINHADLIISLHPKFESGLEKALGNINADKQIIINSDIAHNEHSWLNIERMNSLSDEIVKKLIKIDPNNADIYQKNLRLMHQQLTQLKENNLKKFSAYRNTQITVFSTALMPLLSTNHLKNPIIVTKTHDDRLSIYKIRKAKRAMQIQKSQCLLSTIEISKKRIKTLTEGLNMHTASIDIIGFDQNYFQLMNAISNQVVQCLK